MIRRIVLLAALVLALGLSGTALAAEGDEGVIEGQLINGSEGGSNVAGIEVTLEGAVDNEVVTIGTVASDAPLPTRASLPVVFLSSGKACLAVIAAPMTLTSNWRRQSSASKLSISPFSGKAAFATATSREPNLLITWSTAVAICCS